MTLKFWMTLGLTFPHVKPNAISQALTSVTICAGKVQLFIFNPFIPEINGA